MFKIGDKVKYIGREYNYIGAMPLGNGVVTLVDKNHYKVLFDNHPDALVCWGWELEFIKEEEIVGKTGDYSTTQEEFKETFTFTYSHNDTGEISNKNVTLTIEGSYLTLSELKAQFNDFLRGAGYIVNVDNED